MRSTTLRIQTVGADKGYFAKPFLTALVPAAHPAAHCGQDHRTGGGASAGETAEPDGGLPPLAAGAEEDRRTVGRGEMLARLPALSAARAPGRSETRPI